MTQYIKSPKGGFDVYLWTAPSLLPLGTRTKFNVKCLFTLSMIRINKLCVFSFVDVDEEMTI